MSLRFVIVVSSLVLIGGWFGISLAQQPPVPAPTQPGLPALVVDKPVERELKGGEAHAYPLKLTATQYLHVVVEQKGIDVVVTLFGPDGTKLLEVDSPNGDQGPEPVYCVTEKAGDYRLEVKSLEDNAPPGKYEAKVVEIRVAVKEDTTKITARIAAQKAFSEGQQLESQHTKEAYLKAIEKYQESLVNWRVLGDKQREAATLNNIGRRYSALGEKQTALKYYTAALPLNRAVGDQGGEATTLNNIGAVYADLGENQTALKYLTEALPLRRAVGDQGGEAITLNDMGKVYFALGEKQTALKYLTEALPLRRAVRDRGGEAQTLNDIGLVYDDLGEPQTSLKYYTEALPLRRAVRDRGGEAQTLNNIGKIYSALGEMQTALKYFTEAIPLLRIVGDQGWEGATLINIGWVYHNLGELQTALKYYTEALSLLKAVGHRGWEAVTLNNIGMVYYSLGEMQTALKYYIEAIPLLRIVGNRGKESLTLVNISGVYHFLGEKQLALKYLMEALPIFRAMGDQVYEAGTLSNIGVVYADLGEKQLALKYYTEALPLRRAVGDRGGEATTLNNIGLVYLSLGDRQTALKYFTETLPIHRAVGHRHQEATTLNYIGGVYFDLGENQTALKYYTEALPLFRAMGDRRGEADSLNDIGEVYSDLGENQTALKYYTEALPLFRAIGNRAGEANTLSNIGLVYSNLGEKQTALKYYTEALPIHRAIVNRGSEANTLSNMMYEWDLLKKPKLAIFYGKQSVNLKQELRAALKGLDKELQRTYLKTQEYTYQKLANLLIAEGRLPEAQQVLNMLKEEEYFEFIRRDARSGADLNSTIALSPRETASKTSLDAAMENLGVAAKAYDELNLKPSRTDDETKRLLTLEAALTKAKAAYNQAVATIETELGNTKQAGERMTAINAAESLQDDLRTLGNGTVALYTVMVEEKYHVILTLPTGQKAAQTLIPQVELNKKVLAFREALQNPKIDPRPLGKELYDILVKPIQAELDGFQAQTLMWSLDGVLRYVPMGALWDGKQYLAERYRMVVYTPAAATKLKDTPKPVWAGLGFGMSQSATVTFGEQKQTFSALPGVTDELRSVIREDKTTAKGVLEGKLLLDDKFTEASLREFLRQKFPLVHIASHFSFRPGDETKSFLLLGDGSPLTLDKIKTSVNLFSEVDLLTLSACDTAMGGSSGDGTGKEVEGFGVLAQKQGARAVLASLWPVADASTSLLMQEFYRIRQANPKLPKIEALRQAQLGLLRGTSQLPDTIQRNRGVEEIGEPTKSDPKRPAFQVDPKAPYAHPYYWAPFILMGNWR